MMMSNQLIKKILTHPWVLVVLIILNSPEEVSRLYLIFVLFSTIVFFNRKSKFLFYLMNTLAVGTFFVIIREFHTVFNIDAGTNFLTLLLGVKALEQNKRNLHQFIFLALAVCGTYSLYTQDLYATILLMLSFLYSLWLLIQHTAKENNASLNLNLNFLKNIKVYLYGISISVIAVLFYLFFPRITFHFPKNSNLVSQSGFSPSVNPGEQSELILSNNPVFSVKFNGRTPARDQMYWVGAVLEKTDGYFWKPGARKAWFSKEMNQTSGADAKIKYDLQLQTQSVENLFVLDAPQSAPSIPIPYFKNSNKSFKLYRRSPLKLNYSGSSTLSSIPVSKNRKKFSIPQKYIKASLKIKKLAEQLKGRDINTTLNNYANYFKQEGFVYTLKPGASEYLDDFFKSKRGFCSHFASAVGILLRYSGYQSRLVTGFQGGEYNEISGYYTLRGKDAHAWLEVINDKRQWQRIDPVAWIRPERIQMGGQRFFSLSPNGEDELDANNKNNFNSLTVNLRKYFDNINLKWQRLLYNFDRQAQEELAQKLGIGVWRYFFFGLIFSFALLALFVFYIKKRRNSWSIEKEIAKIEAIARSKNIQRQNSESFDTFLNSLHPHIKGDSNEVHTLQRTYLNYFFSPSPPPLSEIRKTLVSFRKNLNKMLG